MGEAQPNGSTLDRYVRVNDSSIAWNGDEAFYGKKDWMLVEKNNKRTEREKKVQLIGEAVGELGKQQESDRVPLHLRGGQRPGHEIG